MASTTTRVALATGRPTPLPPEHDTALLAATLAADGLAVDVVAWGDDEVSWADYQAVLLCSPSDHDGRLHDLIDWAAGVERVTRLVNPVDVVRWGAHAGHLVELRARGVPTVPTVLIPAESTDVLDQVAECGWEQVVVRAAVDPDGLTVRHGASDDPEILEHVATLAVTGDVLLQSLEALGSAPRRSLVFVGGALAHVVVTAPPDRPAVVGECESADLRAALAALAVLPAEPVLVRVDLVDVPTGSAVVAVEAVGPDLCLDGDPERARRVATLLRAALEA